MIRGLYTAGTGMISQMKKMNVVTNNLANVNTAGFKEDSVLTSSFQEAMVMRLNDPGILNASREVGPLHKGVRIERVYTRFEQGSLLETKNSTDLAIKGEGFFVIRTPQGERLTRDGAFQIDSMGRLVNAEGNPVLGESGEIFVQNNRFTVSPKGEIMSPEGEHIDTIMVVRPDTAGLRKEGGGLYVELNPGAREIDRESTLSQGYLENSNVDLAKSMVGVIEIYRNYESNQRVVKMLDETLGRAVNDIGKV